MPRKQKRGPDGRRTPWYSRKVEEAHAEAARSVRSVGYVRTHAGGTVVDYDALVGVYFEESCYQLRISPGRDGEAWYKCRIPADDGRYYYLLVHKGKHESHSAALVNLCEKIEEMWRGQLDPSPDIWKG